MKKENITLVVLGGLLAVFGIYCLFVEMFQHHTFFRYVLEWFTLGAPFILVGVYAILAGLGVLKKNVLFGGLGFTLFFVQVIYVLYFYFSNIRHYSGSSIAYVALTIVQYLLLFVGTLIGLIKAWKGQSKFVAVLVLFAIGSGFALIADVFTSISFWGLIQIAAVILLPITMNCLGKHFTEPAKEEVTE